MNLTVYTTSTINGQSAEWSFCVKHLSEEIHSASGSLDAKQIGFAGWYALGFALRWLHENYQWAEIVLYSTSAPIVKQIRGTIDTPKAFVGLRDRCRELALEIDQIEIEWMPKEEISRTR